MIITAGRQGEQLCWPEPRPRFSARTGHAMTSTLRQAAADYLQIRRSLGYQL